MEKKILMLLALLGVALAFVTCGNEASVSSSSEYHVSSDIELYMHPCDVSEDGKVLVIESPEETLVCKYDEYLEDWAWIPVK